MPTISNLFEAVINRQLFKWVGKQIALKYASQIFQWFICRTPARPAPNYYILYVDCMPYYVIDGWGQNTFEVSIKFRFVRGLLSQLSVSLV